MKIVRATAYHEAGHAAVAIHLGFGLKRVSAIPGKEYGGFCSQFGSSSLRKQLEWEDTASLTKRAEKKMMVALAGIEAQSKFAARTIRKYHGASDRNDVFEYAVKTSGSDEEASALVELLRIRTRNLLDLPWVWGGVEAIAKTLLKQREISGRQAKEIYKAASTNRD